MLENITLKNAKTGEEKTVPAKALFIYIGTRPGTAWLNDIVLKDEKGFIISGSDLMKEKSFHATLEIKKRSVYARDKCSGNFCFG